MRQLIIKVSRRAFARISKWVASASTFIIFGMPGIALASGTGMPWESPMQQIENSLTGPIAKAIGVFAIMSFGLAFAFSEHGSTLRKGMAILMGVSIAFSAGSFGATFFGFSGGAGW